MNPNRQLKSDPVLDHADAELRSLLDEADVVNDGILRPFPDEGNHSERNGDQCESIEDSNRQRLILLLPHKYDPDVTQGKRD